MIIKLLSDPGKMNYLMKMRCETCLQSPFTFLYQFNPLVMLQIYASTVQRLPDPGHGEVKQHRTLSILCQQAMARGLRQSE